MGWPTNIGQQEYVSWRDFQALMDMLDGVITVSGGGSGGTSSIASGVFDSTSPEAVTLSASAGTATVPSHRDHVHPISQDISPVWTQGHQTSNMVPRTPYTYNLGALTNKYLQVHAAELVVETLVAQDTMATIGGRILVGPTTALIADLAAVDTTIDVKHNNLASGDRVYMEADSKVEFMAVTSAASSITGGYRYSVTRNLDGTGANQWYAGDAVFNTGTTGNGFLDIYSVRGVKAATEVGPTIVGNVRQSATYNDWTPHWAIGNLNGLYGYGATTYGVALGKYATGQPWIGVDATNGLRIMQYTTQLAQWDISGNITIGQVAAGQSNIYITAGAIYLRNNLTNKVVIEADGSASFTGSLTSTDFTLTGGTFRTAASGARVEMNSTGIKWYDATTQRGQILNDGSGWMGSSTAFAWTTAGVVTLASGTTIGGFDIGADYIRDAANSMGMASTVTGSDDVRFWAGDSFTNRATAPARIYESGVAVFTNITATGVITATSGSITGAFTIGTGGTLASGATAVLTGDGYWLAYNAGTPVFRVGTVALGALVKGFYWDGTNPSWIGVNTSLTAAGLFTASNAVITGTITTSNITATGGTIGGWTLAATTLTGGNVVLDSTGVITIRPSTGANSRFIFQVSGETYPRSRIYMDSTANQFRLEKLNETTGAVQTALYLASTAIGLFAGSDGFIIYDSTGATQLAAVSQTGRFAPGNQTTRYLYDAGATSGLAVAGGPFSTTGYIYPGTGSALQTAAYIYGGTTLIGINGEIRNTAIIRTTGVAATHLASSGGLEFVTGSLRIRSQGADASTKGGFTFLGITSDGSADTTFMTITNTGNVTIAGTLTVSGDQTGATDHVFDHYDDLALLQDWRAGRALPFATGDLLNRDRLLRDSVVGLHVRIATLEAEVSSLKARLT